MLLTYRKDGARTIPYPVSMGPGTEAVAQPNAVGRNLAILMHWRGWNQTEVSRRSGVSQRHISDILRGHSDCTSEVMGQLAKAFGIPRWQLDMDDLTEELLTGTELQMIVDTYVRNPAGRKFISGAVEMVRTSQKR